MQMVDLSGVMALAACLPEWKSLTSLKCAAATPKCLLFCQRPLTLLSTCASILCACSLRANYLGSQGALAALTKGLKGNSTLQSLE